MIDINLPSSFPETLEPHHNVSLQIFPPRFPSSLELTNLVAPSNRSRSKVPRMLSRATRRSSSTSGITFSSESRRTSLSIETQLLEPDASFRSVSHSLKAADTNIILVGSGTGCEALMTLLPKRGESFSSRPHAVPTLTPRSSPFSSRRGEGQSLRSSTRNGCSRQAHGRR